MNNTYATNIHVCPAHPICEGPPSAAERVGNGTKRPVLLVCSAEAAAHTDGPPRLYLLVYGPKALRVEQTFFLHQQDFTMLKGVI